MSSSLRAPSHSPKFGLSHKIVVGIVAGTLLVSLAPLVAVYAVSRAQAERILKGRLSGILSQAEETRNHLDQLHRDHAFAIGELLADAKAHAQGRPIREVYRETKLFGTIPVVAAWQVVEKSARRDGFEFFTPSAPGVPARNPANNTGARFAEAFAAFGRGENEWTQVDRAAHTVTIARPVRLTASCLTCHGDPASSPTGDGLDMVGFPMENMKVGDLKGAFVLRAPLDADRAARATTGNVALVSLALMALVVAGGVYLSRRLLIDPIRAMLREVDAAAEHTHDSAADLASASRDIAEGSLTQAAAIEQTSASLEELSSITRQNAGGALASREEAQRTTAATEQGMAAMERLREVVARVRESGGELEAAMREVQGAGGAIAQILKTIDEIAFQTNILALNASVEAARAGEAGLGFAVVADEVRSLAGRVAEAARETARLIENATGRSDRGFQLSQQVAGEMGRMVEISGVVGTRLREIVDRARAVEQATETIHRASGEQSLGIDQINQSMQQCDTITQQNASAAEETAAASRQLGVQAAQLAAGVAALRGIVEGGRQG